MLLYVLYPILLVIYASCMPPFVFFFFFNDTATTEIYTLSLHDALPISGGHRQRDALVLAADSRPARDSSDVPAGRGRSEEHTSELQSPCNLVCRLLLEKKKRFEHKIALSKFGPLDCYHDPFQGCTLIDR